MNARWIRHAVAMAICASVGVFAEVDTTLGEWPTYGGDLASTRYAPLDQIRRENFAKLEIAWRLKTDLFGPRPDFLFQATPLMVDGVVYTTAGTRRTAVALDAGTGEILWVHSENEGPRGEAAPRLGAGRGLAYWANGSDRRIVYVTPGYRMVALDAKTGALVTGFGRNGVVDLKLDNDQPLDPVTGEIGLNAAPIIAGDVIVIGAAHRSGGSPESRRNAKGTSAASTREPGGDSGSFTRFPSRSVRLRDLGGRLGVLHGQHGRMGADERR